MIVDLGRVEQQEDKEVASAEEGDKEDADHSPLGSAEDCPRNHRIWRKLDLPYEKCDYDCQTDGEGNENVRTVPLVL